MDLHDLRDVSGTGVPPVEPKGGTWQPEDTGETPVSLFPPRVAACRESCRVVQSRRRDPSSVGRSSLTKSCTSWNGR
jgi:hypothetical protein